MIKCSDSKIRNPLTGRCINIKKIKEIEDCKEGKIRNPLTGRCINIKKIKEIEDCKEGKIRNPLTGRCINIKTDISKSYIVKNKNIIKNLKILVDYEHINNNHFKSRAYTNAISSIELIDFSINNIEDIKKIDDIGIKVRNIILELLNTGKILRVEKALKDNRYIFYKSFII